MEGSDLPQGFTRIKEHCGANLNPDFLWCFKKRRGKMYKMFFLFIILTSYTLVVQAEEPGDISAIKQTSMNYMESWYQRDGERMKESLHPDLAKRSLQEGSTGERELRHTTASDMVRYTNSGYGRNLWRENYSIEVVVMDFYKNIASVKVITPHYLEYLHLIKKDKEWVIVNALYEKKPVTDN